MEITKLSFNEWVGIKFFTKTNYLLMLGKSAKYGNHLQTVHASAQFALAEAASGCFLLNEFSEQKNIAPVVRKVETKYRKPATNEIFSNARLIEMEKNNPRCLH
ncbi:MAG: DUF4442 domain-containing protein [Dysgonamonadaceae bacterium]|nr:DUF4442 domain-containing protein [Dysgonamonadaceae bacterium]